jgi:TPR repeat protein
MKRYTDLARRVGIAACAAAILALMPGPVPAGTLDAAVRAYLRQNYPRAARLVVPRAEAGDAEAQAYLGYMFTQGEGVPQSYEEAALWLQRSAEQGNPNAQFLLGQLYDRGLGLPQDFLAAELWLDLAAAGADGRRRDYWVRMRDAVAKKLSLDELAQAQRLALAWRPIGER